MAPYPVFTSVQVKNPDHPRAELAGIVCGWDPAHPDQIAVRFDVDGAEQAVALADLRKLG